MDKVLITSSYGDLNSSERWIHILSVCGSPGCPHDPLPKGPSHRGTGRGAVLVPCPGAGCGDLNPCPRGGAKGPAVEEQSGGSGKEK